MYRNNSGTVSTADYKMAQAENILQWFCQFHVSARTVLLGHLSPNSIAQEEDTPVQTISSPLPIFEQSFAQNDVYYM